MKNINNKQIEINRNYDKNSDEDWIITCNDCELAKEISEYINNNTDYYSIQERNNVELEGITVLGNDTGIIEIEEILKRVGN